MKYFLKKPNCLPWFIKFKNNTE